MKGSIQHDNHRELNWPLFFEKTFGAHVVFDIPVLFQSPFCHYFGASCSFHQELPRFNSR